MTAFEKLLCHRISEYEPLKKELAEYGGKPAVFYQMAPDDRQKGWNNKSQYPRLIFELEMQANQERKCAGMLLVSLMCDEVGIGPEVVEPRVKDCLKNLLVSPTDGYPYCFAWSRTDAFEIPARERNADSGVIGQEIRFDIMEYQTQETTDPDPVVALNRYIKSRLPEAAVLGLEQSVDIQIASEQRPIIYVRLESVELGKQTNTVIWMDGRIAVHILCPNPDMRLKLIMSLAKYLSLAGEVIMLDESPMAIERLQVNNQSDYLKEGQLFITVRFGLLRYKSKPHAITEVIGSFR